MPVRDDSMRFEHTLMLFFGRSAYQTAGQAGTPKLRRAWLRRILRVLLKTIDKIETTPRHKQVLMATTEKLLEDVGSRDQPTWALVYGLIAILGRVIGFDLQRGHRLHTISYWQTKGQYYVSDMLLGGDALQNFDDRLDAVTIRQRLVQTLKDEGLSDFKIALVLNATEHEIQQLRHGTHKDIRTKQRLKAMEESFQEPPRN